MNLRVPRPKFCTKSLQNFESKPNILSVVFPLIADHDKPLKIPKKMAAAAATTATPATATAAKSIIKLLT